MKETITAKELEEAMNAILKQARKMENPTMRRSTSTDSEWKAQ